MPHRTDKRDFLTLMGLVTDIDISFIDGVNGSDMQPDAIPPVRIACPPNSSPLPLTKPHCSGKASPQSANTAAGAHI